MSYKLFCQLLLHRDMHYLCTVHIYKRQVLCHAQVSEQHMKVLGCTEEP